MTERERKLYKLKEKARKWYTKATLCEHLDCGRTLAEYISPSLHYSRIKFNKIWEKIKKLDPKAPDNPLDDFNKKSSAVI